MVNYIKRHWQGDLSLAIAFWINFVALRFLLFVFQANLLDPPDKDYSAWSVGLWLLIVLGHGVLFVWQVVGVFRSAERYLKETGSQATVWGAQLCTVFGLFLTISYAMQAWQATIPKPEEDNFLVRMEKEHASKYELKTSSNRKALSLDGTIELGITRNLRNALEMNPEIKMLVLRSSGGNIFEARGIAKLVRERGLTTHVNDFCSSACTMAYSGGVTRSMASGARFGFHQYRLDATYTVISSDPKEEQVKDISLFKTYGVAEDFLQKIYSVSSKDMWFPEREELLKARFVHKIRDGL